MKELNIIGNGHLWPFLGNDGRLSVTKNLSQVENQDRVNTNRGDQSAKAERKPLGHILSLRERFVMKW
jgi:hypothetical protein